MKAATDKGITFWVDNAFQSTPPVKAATITQRFRKEAERISIHAAREGGDIEEIFVNIANAISIHAAREGGDHSFFILSPRIKISIHAAREGGDLALHR